MNIRKIIMNNTMEKYVIPFLILYLIFGCSSPENIAEKALKEIGSGKYKSDPYGICFQKLKMFDNTIYSKNELENYYAKFGYESGLEDVFFQTEKLFEKYNLLDKKEIKIDLYNYIRFDNKNISDSLFRSNALLAFKHNPKFKSDSISCQYMQFENITKYILRYNIEGKYILNIDVIDHPKDGLKVSRFMYE